MTVAATPAPPTTPGVCDGVSVGFSAEDGGRSGAMAGGRLHAGTSPS